MARRKKENSSEQGALNTAVDAALDQAIQSAESGDPRGAANRVSLEDLKKLGPSTNN